MYLFESGEEIYQKVDFDSARKVFQFCSCTETNGAAQMNCVRLFSLAKKMLSFSFEICCHISP